MTESATAAALTEAQMLAGIRKAAEQLGYQCYHTTYAVGSTPGYPDLTIVGHGKTFFYELKGPRGRVSRDQQAWIDALFEAGQRARIVWPQDYDSVLEELASALEWDEAEWRREIGAESVDYLD